MSIVPSNVPPNASSLARSLRAGAALGVALSAIAFAARAQTAPVQLPPVSVEADRPGADQYQEYNAVRPSSPKYTAPLRETPQSIDVVTRKTLDEQGARTLGDALRNVTGISMAAGEGGTPNGDAFTIRGYSARTDIFVDGMRDFGGYFRDTFNLDAVEVLKGPTSMTFGRGSTGGVINQVSKTPLLDAFNTASVSLGTDMTRRVAGDSNYTVDNASGTALRVNAMVHHNEYANRDIAENNRFGFAPSIAWGLGMPTTITASYLHQAEDNVPDYGLSRIGVGPAPVNINTWYGIKGFDYETTRVDVLTLKVEHEFNDAVKISNKLRYGQTGRRNYITEAVALNSSATQVARSPKAREQQDNILINQTDLTTKFNTGFIGHTLVSGLELAEEATHVQQAAIIGPSSANLVNPSHVGNVGRIVDGGHQMGLGQSIAGYAVDTLKLNPQWDLIGGVRVEQFDGHFENVTGAINVGRTDVLTSYRTGVVYKPAPNGSIYVSYGNSYNPSAESLTLSTAGTAANSASVGPEESVTYETGTKWDLFDRLLSMRAAVFRTEKTNARTASTGTDPVVLEGEQRVDGFELEASGRITDKWRVMGGYTYLDSEVTKSKNTTEIGHRLSNVPQQTVSLWTTYQLTDRFQIGGGAQFVDQRYTAVANTTNVPGYIRYDAMADYRLTDAVDVRLNLYNLTDEEYFDKIHPNHFVPGAGRSAVLTTSFKF